MKRTLVLDGAGSIASNRGPPLRHTHESERTLMFSYKTGFRHETKPDPGFRFQKRSIT